MPVNVKSTSWSKSSVNSSSWTKGSISSVNWTKGSINSTSFEPGEIFSESGLLYQNGTDLLLYQDGNILGLQI